MLLRVNRRIGSPVLDLEALLSGTVSNVWHDEESESQSAPKRQNHIRVMHAPLFSETVELN